MAAVTAEALYQQQIRRLPPEEQLHLLALVAQGLATGAPRGKEKTRSILELEGLGADLWQGIDAQEYIDEMRDEWDRQP